MCCGVDTLFNAQFLVCDFAFAVDCGDRPMPGSTRPPPPTTTTPKTTRPITTTNTTTTTTTTTTCAITEY